MAVASGLSAANLYYAQPLAAEMAQSLSARPAAVGGAMMSTQVGYAIGMILLVPLGDGRERRSMIVTTLLAAVPALLLVASAQSIPALVMSSFLVGVASSVPQMILPYAVDLVPVEDRGKVVGTIMAGLLSGILLSRTAAGALGAVLGWRAVFVIAAVMMASLAGVLRAAIPKREPATHLPYRAILGSLATVFRDQPVLRRRALVGALGFASFSVFWSMLSFQLAQIGYGSATAGVFGAIGIVGVFVAPVAGRFATGDRPSRINVAALLLTAASFGLFALSGHSLVLIGLGVVLLDAGVQASHLTNQTVIFGLAPALRSRINALYMVTYFAGGALGTVAASYAWSEGKWPAVCLTGAAFALAAMLPLIGERRLAKSS
ncbi:Major facilitator superfamily (MFS_1) transporter [Labilithrix luteola]|uniref:Major facilitator superfamily (MFS_1) transporter n=1 Tax=Labilithrix luteola TaxID=1391654 RepID=A0A0K1Q0G6_9BACT|nr:Major facilitator superfamily (MFS_1) transporter [Labilithrix luteola]